MQMKYSVRGRKQTFGARAQYFRYANLGEKEKKGQDDGGEERKKKVYPRKTGDEAQRNLLL